MDTRRKGVVGTTGNNSPIKPKIRKNNPKNM